MSPDSAALSAAPLPRILILLVNWHGWQDTIECLESVYRLASVNFQVLVCDNQSGDGSLECIQDWAQGKIEARAKNPALAYLIAPPIAKPVQCVRFKDWQQAIASAERAELILIETGGNLGFAGGNNCGIRYFLARAEFTHLWLLNNDTSATPDALAAMLKTMGQHASAGLAGSQLRSYYHPDTIMVQGGKYYSPRTARVHANLDPAPLRPLHYVDGASMLVSRAFIERAGLMNEDYFLYGEELDWAQAAARHGFTQTFATESIVFHKEGASAGSSGNAAQRSLLADRYLTRSRLFFTRRYYPWALPTVVLWQLLTAVRALLLRDGKRMFVILRATWEGFSAKLSSAGDGN